MISIISLFCSDVYPFPNFKSFSIDTTYHNPEDDEDIGIHTESYRSALWLYIRRKDELTVWDHKCNRKHQSKQNGGSAAKLVRTDSDESTVSERQFRRHYESVTHRMIHRRASIEMYKRAMNKTFGESLDNRMSLTFSPIFGNIQSNRKGNSY